MKKEYKDNQKELDEMRVIVQAIKNQYYSKVAELNESIAIIANEGMKKIRAVQDRCPHDWEFHADIYNSFYSCKACGKEKTK